MDGGLEGQVRNMAGRKKRRNRNGKKALLFGAVLLLFFLGLFLFGMFATIKQVTFVGNSPYEEEELRSLIFENRKEQSFLYAYVNNRFGSHKTIPFIERYEMHFTGIDSVEITLYEKNIVACIEYMGSYMYFDKDGIVVESSGEKKEDVPLISGLTFDRIVLHSVLSISSEEVFEDILNLTQLLQKYELFVDKIYFDSQYHVVFYLDRIKVRLGSLTSLDGKITELKQMLPKLSGMSGTLYLDTYSDTLPPSSYVFKKEEPSSESEVTPEEESSREEENGN